MAGWFHRTIVESGRLPLFCFFAAMIVGFLFIRASVRLIRADVRWWFGNVEPGGTHIHHVVFGVVLMMVGGVAGIAIPNDKAHLGWLSVAAAVFGVGSALVLDEFALILHLRDVYWAEEGRTSVDAVFVGVAVGGLLLLGERPVFIVDLLTIGNDISDPATFVLAVILSSISIGLAVITLLKGKIWTGLLGLFVDLLLVVGAVRLARPNSPWARWRYRPDSKKLKRATWRERRLRSPLISTKIRLQELISGRPDQTNSP